MAAKWWRTRKMSTCLKTGLDVFLIEYNATVRAAYELGDTRWEDSVAVDLTTVPAAMSPGR